MKVIFDFDDVIFDNKSFKRELFALLSGYKHESFEDLYMQARSLQGVFSLDSFLKQFFPEKNDQERDVIYVKALALVPGKVHEGVLKLITELGKESCFIVSQGDERFQMEKISRVLGVATLKGVYIVEFDKKEVIQRICEQFPEESIIFVDDKASHFVGLSGDSFKNLTTVLFDEHGFMKLQDAVAKAR